MGLWKQNINIDLIEFVSTTKYWEVQLNQPRLISTVWKIMYDYLNNICIKKNGVIEIEHKYRHNKICKYYKDT